MSNPEKIYRYEEHICGFNEPHYSDVPYPEHAIEYLRSDIHEAEVNALKAEIAALKAPPVVLSAEQVTEAGEYRWRKNDIGEWITVEIRYLHLAGYWVSFFGDEEDELLIGPDSIGGQFIGPIKYPEV